MQHYIASIQNIAHVYTPCAKQFGLQMRQNVLWGIA